MAQFTNFATLSYNGVTLTSNTVTGELLENITAVKTATSDTYAVGETVTYAVALTNTGSNPVTGLTLTDDLGGTLYDGNMVYPLAYVEGTLRLFVNGALQPAPAVTAGPPLTVTGLSLPAAGNAVLIYEAAVTQYASPAADGEITNTATVTGGGLAQPVTASMTLTAAQEAQLKIVKSLSPAAVAVGDTVTYTFLIENRGNTAVTSSDGVVVGDTFDPLLTGLVVTYDGATKTVTTDYTYQETTGVFATTAGLVEVPAAVTTQNPDGTWNVAPGTVTLTITGVVQP